MKQWEIIADNLSKAGWSLGWVSAIDSQGQTISIVDAHCGGKRFVVHADEKLTALMEVGSGDSVSKLGVNDRLQHFYGTALAMLCEKVLQKPL